LVADDLLATAKRLTAPARGRPRQSDLRRAISTAYYALFHGLARDAADLMVGTGVARAGEAWAQVYRALEHGFAKNACKQIRSFDFSDNIIRCADTFVRLQELRHKADYDPKERYGLVYACFVISLAESGLAALRNAPRAERRAFAVQLLLKKRAL